MILSHHRRETGPAPSAGTQFGAILILALLFLTVILGGILVLLQYGQTSSNSLQAYRGDRSIHYGADSALEEEIWYLSRSGVGITGACGTNNWPLVPQHFTQPAWVNTRGGAAPVTGVTSASTLQLTCAQTPGTTRVPLDPDGGQSMRDLTLTVTCLTNGNLTITSGQGKQYVCGTGTNSRLPVASARVQFLPDTTAANPLQRTTITKVISWTIYRN